MTDIDVPSLVAALRSRVVGEIRFGDGDRALYATDSSRSAASRMGCVSPPPPRHMTTIPSAA